MMTNRSKHTRGNWGIDERKPRRLGMRSFAVTCHSKKGLEVIAEVDCYTNRSDDEVSANARLISLAGDLYTQLNALATAIEYSKIPLNEMIQADLAAARELLYKATDLDIKQLTPNKSNQIKMSL